MATSSEMNPELIEQFIAVTGAAHHVAVSMLEACAGNLDMAVGMHMDGGGGALPGPLEASDNSSQVNGVTAAAAGQPPIIRDDEDDVRAPIPQKTEVLVEDDPSKYASWRMRRPRRAARSVFDGFRDFQAEARMFEDNLRGKASSKKRNLEDLFRPPVDITHKGTFQTARDIGSSQNRWLLVNVQNVQEFACQTLNRDVWSCQWVRDILKDHFIFWQVYNDSEEGLRFMQFYQVTQWPHVAILDPFTGESQVVWHKIADGAVFCDLAKEFLSIQHVPDKSQAPSPTKRLKHDNSLVDASEQDQMEAAIKASLDVAHHASTSSSPQYVMDSDSEADLLDDSVEEVETFSDSDELVVSTGSFQKSSPHADKREKKKLSPSPLTRPALSSYSQAMACSANSSNKSLRKDTLSQCKKLSTIGSSCKYSPQSLISEEAGSSSNGSGASNTWILSGHTLSTMRMTSPLRVDIDIEDSLDPPCNSSFTCPPSSSSSRHRSMEEDLPPSTSRGLEAFQREDRSAPDWREFWGDPTDPVSKIILRFPDNRREPVELPCSSLLKALTVHCSSLGFPPDQFELVTNFPRRKLSQLGDQKTLREIGLHPQETVFVQDL